MLAKMWSGQNKLYWLFVPLSFLYGLLVFCRKKFYQWGIFKSWQAPVPVVIVGNLSVGGNGKTPLVIYLVEHLTAKGYQVGVVSKGYGGKSDHYPLIVSEQTSASIVGDEPVLVYQRTHVPFAVSPKRSDAVQLLLKNYPIDIIITDDGLQHYALKRDIEIVVVDGKRGFGNGWYLPAGPMRETSSRLKSVDFVVINGPSEQHYQDAYTMTLEPHQAINLLTQECRPVNELKAVSAMAGIGDPSRFFTMLEKNNVELIKTTAFMDHQDYSQEQLLALADPQQVLLMTEKDAVKCSAFAQKNWWYLPIDAKLTELFLDNLLIKLNK
ncbi:tetraacyldisaccharide 4'-kinase [Orbus mooreae]|uniref:tetraacyldisaccharide 4'-kinase n=1 Tax=Orbus mooreae TaxID=3074107 RepID=UPI00370D041F